MKRFRFHPTYSNVVATLALFLALAGGAWAATKLPKGSVGSTQLAKGAVTPEKLSAQAKKGFTGPRGETGPQGALGPRGNEGQRGENGAAGATGPQGIRGATGAGGATGSRGEPGERGLRGEIGAQGDPGPQGVQGIPGVPGEKGDPGEPGAEGEPGPIGPSDAYFDVTEPGAVQVGHEAKVVLEVTNLPAGEYVLQAAITLEGIIGPAIAECQFVGGGPITVGTAAPFSTTVTLADIASLAGMGTAVATGPGTVDVTCETVVEGTNFTIPPESGHLTVTKVGTLHPQSP